MDIIVKKIIPPKGDFCVFNNLNEKVEFMKKIGLISKNAKDIKPFFYNGDYTETYCLCDVVGFKTEKTLVIKLDNKLHCINTDCFIEMQPLVKEHSLYINNVPKCEEE